ncbi:nitroreductase family protein [Treponema sp. OMZ 840]|uniref:nitroreductase family protein n=1 Tax=Treponema sp. OMZ 840 TaxID=244313 RepID=UPI003D90A093
MDFFEAIEKRYSFRGEYTDKTVSKQDMRKILDAGIRAPSGRNGQTTSFIAVTDKDLLKKIAGVIDKPCVKTAPLIIAVLTEKVEVFEGRSFEIEDYGAAVENILLAATALGYASLWLDGYTGSGNNSRRLAEILDVPSHLTVRTILPVGVPAEEGKQRERKAFEERVYLEKYR